MFSKEDYKRTKQLIFKYLNENYQHHYYKGKKTRHAGQRYLMEHISEYRFHKEGLLIGNIRIIRNNKPTQIHLHWIETVNNKKVKIIRNRISGKIINFYEFKHLIYPYVMNIIKNSSYKEGGYKVINK